MPVRIRSALVTGGGEGIGRATCLLLSQHGVPVTVVEISGEAAAATAAACEGEALAVACDCTDEKALASAFKAHVARWGTLDLCVPNAGVAEGRGWRGCVSLNLTALISTVRLALGEMRGRGTIVCVGSMGGLLPMADQPVYAATKAAVLHYVRSLAERLRLDGEMDGVSVSAIAPAIVETALAAEQRRLMEPLRVASADELLAQQGGALQPAAIAEAIVRLALTPNSNGAILRVFQAGVLKFVQHPPAARYPTSPEPPARLAAMPSSRL